MKHEFWFVVGTQYLYGTDVLEIVKTRAQEMAEKLSAVLPYPLVFKTLVKTNEEATDIVREANYHKECAGIVTWCHTFSPSKMWINGLLRCRNPTAIWLRSTIKRSRTKRSTWIS